jgi:hypothetical protein
MMPSEEDQNTACESYTIKKLRQKLCDKLDQEYEYVTPEAIEKVTVEIYRWIARKAPDRAVLRRKKISLFDENQTPAKISHRIEAFAKKVSVQFEEKASSLKDRVIQTKLSDG